MDTSSASLKRRPRHPSQPEEAPQALTGDYCLREGTWAASPPDSGVAALPGPPCRKIQTLACYRRVERRRAAVPAALLLYCRPTPVQSCPYFPIVYVIPRCCVTLSFLYRPNRSSASMASALEAQRLQTLAATAPAAEAASPPPPATIGRTELSAPAVQAADSSSGR